MAQITAAAVNELRKETGLPLMDCKKALTESGGDKQAAIRWLRERGAQLQGSRGDRATDFGRFGLYTGERVGAMVELKCESAPVAQNEEFLALAAELARQLAEGPGAATADELLDQPSPSQPEMTLRQRKDDLFNRIREVFNVGRLVRVDGRTAGYEHYGARVHGVLVRADGGEPDRLKDICMHIAAMAPGALRVEDLDPKEVESERQILREAALKEGKPEQIVDKMVEGRLRLYYAQRVLTEQPFVKENSLTVAQFAQQHGIQILAFHHWTLG